MRYCWALLDGLVSRHPADSHCSTKPVRIHQLAVHRHAADVAQIANRLGRVTLYQREVRVLADSNAAGALVGAHEPRRDDGSGGKRVRWAEARLDIEFEFTHQASSVSASAAQHRSPARGPSSWRWRTRATRPKPAKEVDAVVAIARSLLQAGTS